MSRVRRKPISRAVEAPAPARTKGVVTPEQASEHDDEVDVYDAEVYEQDGDGDEAVYEDDDAEDVYEDDEDDEDGAYDDEDVDAEDGEDVYEDDEDGAYDDEDVDAEDGEEVYEDDDEAAYDDEDAEDVYEDDDEAVYEDEDAEEVYEDEDEEQAEAPSPPARRGRFAAPPAKRSRPTAAPAGRQRTAATARAAATPDTDATPSPYRMQPPEPVFGYVVAAVLLAVSCTRLPSIINGTHTDYLNYFVLGVVASILLAVAAWRRMRFVAIVVAILGGSLASPPKHFKPTWLPEFTLAVAFAYGFWLMLHLSKAQRALRLAKGTPVRRQRGSARDSSPSSTPARGKTAKATSTPATATGRALPPASRRYTPPKSKTRRR